MRLMLLAACCLPLALVGCDRNDASSKADGNSVASMTTEGDRMRIDIPGLGASLKLPRIDIGSHMDLDGVKLFPGSQVAGVDVRDDSPGKEGGGRVRLDFTAAAPPAEVADYYRGQAADAGFTVDPSAGGSTVKAAKSDGSALLVTIDADGQGSRGRILIGKD